MKESKLPMVKKNQLASQLVLADVWVFTTESVRLKQDSDLYFKLPTASSLSQSATTLTLYYSFFDGYLFLFFPIQIAPHTPWAPLCLQVQALSGVSSVPVIAGSFSLSLNRCRLPFWLSTSSQGLVQTTGKTDQYFGTSTPSVHPSTNELTLVSYCSKGQTSTLSPAYFQSSLFFFAFPHTVTTVSEELPLS